MFNFCSNVKTEVEIYSCYLNYLIVTFFFFFFKSESRYKANVKRNGVILGH